MSSLTLRTTGAQRVWGLLVFVGCTGAALALAVTGGAPLLTWGVLAVVGGAAAIATLANFGDRWVADDDGISYRNELTGRMGWPRPRRAAWADVLTATDHEGRTWFIDVEGQRRWVLDHVDGHHEARQVFEAHGVSIRESRLPRPFRREPPGAR